jgi:hypothetical protein
MDWLKKIYKNNIYGVMGTLLFLILIVAFFLLNGINIRAFLKDDTVIIDLRDIIQDEATLQKLEMSLASKEQSKGNVSGSSKVSRNEPASSNSRQLTNRASNFGSAKDDKFFNEGYQKEISDAKKLVSQVSNQLKKEVVKIGDIQMPVEKTTGMKKDSIKNVVYTGESNIVYNLQNRYHVSLPIPVYLAQGGGSVTVDIVVDRNGNVVKAISRKNSQIRDSQVFYYAELAASNTHFNPDQSAPDQQKGTIRYNFIAQ